MRINVYSQELTSEVNVIEKEANTGLVQSVARLVDTYKRSGRVAACLEYAEISRRLKMWEAAALRRAFQQAIKE
jgi:hypothetical protein